MYEFDIFFAYIVSPSVPKNHNTTGPAQHILNDTSLAAVVLANDDRQFFFQDNNGDIRRAIRTASNSKWSTSFFLNSSALPEPDPEMNHHPGYQRPKNLTPMAATLGTFDQTEVEVESLE